MSYSQQIKSVRDALLSVSSNVYHYRRPESIGAVPYIIWQEDGEGITGGADNMRLPYQSAHGTIDLFTLTEYDGLVDQIQEALDNAAHIAWRLNSVQYEDETNLIHYEWEFEATGYGQS